MADISADTTANNNLNAQMEPGLRPSLPPPTLETGAVGWLRHNLFSSWVNAILTVLALYILYLIIPPFLAWAVFDATWTVPPLAAGVEDHPPQFADCRANAGACWIFVEARLPQFVYGFYTAEQRWRVDIVFLILAVSIFGLLSERIKRKKELAIFFFAIFPILAFWLLYGGLGLEVVETRLWGGFMLTLILSGIGIVFSLPLGVLLALGRRSDLPVVHMLCVVMIEFVRGVPLITILFMANVMLPFFLPPGVEFNVLLRVLLGVTIFAAAYMAEVVRGGLQALPKGQYEGAMAMGLGYWQMMRLIILPQALRIAIPGIVNNFISLTQDTTLVAIVGLYDFLNIVRAGSRDTNWLGTEIEGYVFCALVYWIFCFAMSRYSMHLERKLHTGHKKR
ncbi:amino acid ABC transporter permease [Dongia sedimenti]|uniref:Amino acid ABC transporter permease n=1 Tax=Dongia sedimenti TaxID=3064282 RepID=A0ABU0YV35_9PROT|nr:amino acid ABC transporter permease [Rhodospirillaceae bacterium R-7]